MNSAGTCHVKLPVSSVYRINELMTWFMLTRGQTGWTFNREKPYVAKPVRLRPRKITMTVVIMNSTEAERVTPSVNTHYIA
jgi:hypothetical protein